jgi:hypothetical protein
MHNHKDDPTPEQLAEEDFYELTADWTQEDIARFAEEQASAAL